MKAGLVWGSLIALIGGAAWLLFQVGSTSPTVATIPRQSPLPTSTPDGRIDTLVILVQNIQPSPTKTPKPDRTPLPTHTPIPQCGTGVIGLCDQHTPTPTKTAVPTWTPSPTLGPCGTPDARGVYPRFCWGTE